MSRPVSIQRRASWTGHRVALLAFLALFFVTSRSGAAPFTPPALRGHVVDQAGALTDVEVRRLDRKLDRARQQTGFAIVVFILPHLPEGASIDDVAYTTFNTWHVGSAKGDDGVLLVAALGDNKLKIETGKGAGGALTDIASSHINREVIGPLLRQGRNYDAFNQGTDAILREMRASEPGGSAEGKKPAARGPPDLVKTGIVVLLIIGVIVLAIISPTFREILFWAILFGGRGGRGGGGGDSGSGYSGGGSSGGGGSSDDY